MTTNPQRIDPAPAPLIGSESSDFSNAQVADQPQFDSGEWVEHRAGEHTEEGGAGGRAVLGWALTILSALWLAYSAWSAGRMLGGQSLTSPAVAQWIAVATGPLALLGLVWLMFGRTRRKEAERFTRSVVAMRSEAQSLEALLEVLTQRIHDSRADLTKVAQHLMQLGDDATGKLGGITRQFDVSSEQLRRHGDALDRAAGSARTDIAVLLDDLPRIESSARGLAEQLHTIGNESGNRTEEFGRRVGTIAASALEAETIIAESTDRLSAKLVDIERAGTAAQSSVADAERSFSGALDTLLNRTADVLGEIRSGIDIQASAVDALVRQSAAGIGKAGADAAEAFATHVDHADNSLRKMAERIAEQEQSSQRMIAEIASGLALIDQRFTELSATGDEHANHFLDSLSRARGELDAMAATANDQDEAIGALAQRTDGIRTSIDGLLGDLRDSVGAAGQLSEASSALKPEIRWIREATAEAGDRLTSAGIDIAAHQDRLAALMASVDDGVGDAQSKLTDLASVMVQVEREAANLSSETAPALVAALVQVKEAAAHGAERAREAIERIIPECAGKLSEETRRALDAVIRDSIEGRLRGVEQMAARAVESASAASDRLTAQMLSLGQSAAALERHVEDTDKQHRDKDSEAFARRVSLLMDSMNSAAIDVGKILSDEVDEKAWDSYLKGNRGVFTSRAVKLIGGSETRPIRGHYDSDPEFQRSTNHYIHDFEAMLRRVLAERDGGMMAVTLMTSDMGKLYAALNQALDRRR